MKKIQDDAEKMNEANEYMERQETPKFNLIYGFRRALKTKATSPRSDDIVVIDDDLLDNLK